MSISSALAIAQNGLGVVEKKITVTSNNITNADKPGYSRETYTANYLFDGINILASGGSVQSSVDENVNREIFSQNSDHEEKNVLSDYWASYDARIGSTDSSTSNTISSSLNNLVTAISTLTNSPSDASAKSSVVSAADSLTTQLNTLSQTVQSYRLQANQQISDTIKSINDTLDDLLTINKQIAASGQDSNLSALQDQRNVDLKNLSGQIGIQYTYDGNNLLQVYTTSGESLLSVTYANHLSYTPATSVGSTTAYPVGFTGITVQGKDLTTNITTGKLAGLIQLRDTTFPNEQAKLDAFADTLKTTVNNALNTGASVPPRNTMIGDTTVSGSDAFSGTGTLRVAVTDKNGIVKGYSDIDLSGFSTVDDVVGALNGVGGISASVTSDGKLSITSTDPNYGVSLNSTGTSAGGDSLGFSAYFGLNNMFDSTRGASDIHVSNYLKSNSAYLSSGELSNSATLQTDTKGITHGDNTAIQGVYTALTGTASFDAAGDFAAQNTSLSSYANAIIAAVASASSNAKKVTDNSNSVLSTLETTQSEISGVNIDEETANSVTLQNAYNATAKILSTLSEMFNSLLQAI